MYLNFNKLFLQFFSQRERLLFFLKGFDKLKNFSSNEIRGLRADIVLQKQSGLTIAEITEEMLPYCVDIDEYSVLYSKIKCQWDSYVRAQKKALSDSDDEEEEPVQSNVPDEPKFSKAISEKQDVIQNEDGSKDSTKIIQNRHLNKAINSYTKEDLLDLHGFVPVSEWELVSAKSSQWQAQAAGGEIIDMVASKVSAVPKSHSDEIISQIIKSAEEKFGPISKKRHPMPVVKEYAQEIAIAPLADFHLDKREADNAAMSFELQVQRFYAIIDWFYNKFKSRPNLAKIVFYWSQDFFNYDYMTEETTSRRNKQDSSAGYNKMVSTGNMVLVNAIMKLEEIAPVELFYTRSNHDQHTAFNTMACLYCAFRNDENVLIDGMMASERNVVWDRIQKAQMSGKPVECDVLFDTAGRHYLMWGESLFGFAHGDTEGNRIHNVMQTEADSQFARLYAKREGLYFDGNINKLPEFPEKFAWSKTRYHVFFCGHFHSKQKIVKDESGVEVIYLGTEMTGDAWHKNCGYIGAQQRIESYIYNKRGEYEVLATQSAALKEDWEKKYGSDE